MTDAARSAHAEAMMGTSRAIVTLLVAGDQDAAADLLADAAVNKADLGLVAGDLAFWVSTLVEMLAKATGEEPEPLWAYLVQHVLGQAATDG